MAGFLQSINRLRVTGKYVTTTLTTFYDSPLIYLEIFLKMFWKLYRSIVAYSYCIIVNITSTISRSSVLSMHPLPSLSYILNVHLSLCSSLPLRTKFKAATYSRKSMVLSCVHKEKEFKCYEKPHNSKIYVRPQLRSISSIVLSVNYVLNSLFRLQPFQEIVKIAHGNIPGSKLTYSNYLFCLIYR